ncbi:S49 family peptidase [Oceanibaculum indicum]|uniref:Peptidase S49 domain-containing protein n=1 Tax=Oceanibaculum indicum P24 TaxID=1207063 RepID=K2J7I5_9PROT|nr:S49 family peptidase [Oceanibaculum indicum]EKE70887.1 hypothetical protein P24_15129 [Oceanibaculum indicum P24]
MNALDFVLAEPWAITEDYLRAILAIASRDMNAELEALQAKAGKPLMNTRAVTVRDGVAVIPVVGPMFPRANLFTEVSGATSYEVLATDFNRALEDGSVRAIVTTWSTPGGAAEAVNELAGMIHGARGRKPIAAYVGGSAASAGYWLASAVEPGLLVMDATATVGSIGVMGTYIDTRERDARAGVKEVRFISSNAPDKNRDPISDPEGAALVQRRVDALEAVFIETVARNRGVTVEKVKADFGRGDVIVGRAAVDAGMADSLGSLEGLIASLKDGGRSFPGYRPSGSAPAAGATQEEKNMPNENTITTEAALRAAYPDMVSGIEKAAGASALASVSTVDQLKAGFPSLVASVEKDAKDAAVKDERARLIAIDDATLPGCEALAKEAKETGLSAADFSLKQTSAIKAKGADALKSIQASAAPAVDTGKPGTGDAPGTASPANARQISDRIAAIVASEKQAGRTISYADAAGRAADEFKAAAAG